MGFFLLKGLIFEDPLVVKRPIGNSSRFLRSEVSMNLSKILIQGVDMLHRGQNTIFFSIECLDQKLYSILHTLF